MYKVEKVKPGELKKVKIRRQDKIIELIGKKLSAQTAFETLKRETKNFTEENETAKKTDELLAILFKREGILEYEEEKEESEKESERTLEIKERERARALKLLALELELAA